MPDQSGTMVRIAADAILTLHALWVVFLVGGVLVVRGYPWAERLHVGGLVFNLVLDLTGLPCPLTVAETALRLRCNPPCAYQGSCITNYLAGLFPVVAWPGIQAWVGVLLLGVALWRYGLLPRGLPGADAAGTLRYGVLTVGVAGMLPRGIVGGGARGSAESVGGAGPS